MTQEIQKFADAAMFQAEPMERKEGETFIEPKVHLLWMTPDPLGAIAAACRMYEGKPTYNLADITDEERVHYFAQVQKTHLTAPLEFVKFHWFIEGVDRAFTHQIVRQRTAVFAQESLRFAVKDNMAEEAVVPISVQQNPDALADFVYGLEMAQQSYDRLVARGIPAEDARALLPHAVSTRLNFCTDLRNIVDHAGNRLCTQAQYHWRMVFNKIVGSIRQFPQTNPYLAEVAEGSEDWQFEMLADSALFRPVCYQRGHCPFQASFDRGCSIRTRVDAFASRGVPSSQWHEQYEEVDVPLDSRGVLPWGSTKNRGEFGPSTSIIPPISPAEWLLDPTAGITFTEADRPGA